MFHARKTRLPDKERLFLKTAHRYEHYSEMFPLRKHSAEETCSTALGLECACGRVTVHVTAGKLSAWCTYSVYREGVYGCVYGVCIRVCTGTCITGHKQHKRH